MLDLVAKTFYELKYELTFTRATGMAFQGLFVSIMEKRYPSDFIAVRPWGAEGDRKNDGYVASRRQLFQVYGPENLRKPSTACKKIAEDLKGAIPHWEAFFDAWIFVHNVRDGLPPAVVSKLLELKQAHTQITVGWWGFEELRSIVFELSEDHLISLFGLAPTHSMMSSITYEDIRTVLTGLATHTYWTDAAVMPVPEGKLSYNRLSPQVRTLLIAGMLGSSAVKRFFADWHDAELGDRVATLFRNEYWRLKSLQADPDIIFDELWKYVGPCGQSSARLQSASLALLTHLFESCDIFENPPGASS